MFCPCAAPRRRPMRGVSIGRRCSATLRPPRAPRQFLRVASTPQMRPPRRSAASRGLRTVGVNLTVGEVVVGLRHALVHGERSRDGIAQGLGRLLRVVDGLEALLF